MAAGPDIARKLHELVDRDLSFMHICGTHEASIARHGIRSLLPPRLKIVMGPGCPVCITDLMRNLRTSVRSASSHPE